MQQYLVDTGNPRELNLQNPDRPRKSSQKALSLRKLSFRFLGVNHADQVVASFPPWRFPDKLGHSKKESADNSNLKRTRRRGCSEFQSGVQQLQAQAQARADSRSLHLFGATLCRPFGLSHPSNHGQLPPHSMDTAVARIIERLLQPP